MPVWGALAATLGWNYSRHLQHKSTLCSASRRHVKPLMFVSAWGVLTGWLVGHYIDGFPLNLDNLTKE